MYVFCTRLPSHLLSPLRSDLTPRKVIISWNGFFATIVFPHLLPRRPPPSPMTYLIPFPSLIHFLYLKYLSSWKRVRTLTLLDVHTFFRPPFLKGIHSLTLYSFLGIEGFIASRMDGHFFNQLQCSLLPSVCLHYIGRLYIRIHAMHRLAKIPSNA